MQTKVFPKFNQRDYTAALTDLAALRPSIDQYFEDAMVMDENTDIRNNRIATLWFKKVYWNVRAEFKNTSHQT